MKSSEQIDSETWVIVKRISKNLKANRKQQGLTQTDMARHGFGTRWYQRLESGRHIPTIPTLHRLSVVFKVDIAELFK